MELYSLMFMGGSKVKIIRGADFPRRDKIIRLFEVPDTPTLKSKIPQRQ